MWFERIVQFTAAFTRSGSEVESAPDHSAQISSRTLSIMRIR